MAEICLITYTLGSGKIAGGTVSMMANDEMFDVLKTAYAVKAFINIAIGRYCTPT